LKKKLNNQPKNHNFNLNKREEKDYCSKENVLEEKKSSKEKNKQLSNKLTQFKQLFFSKMASIKLITKKKRKIKSVNNKLKEEKHSCKKSKIVLLMISDAYYYL